VADVLVEAAYLCEAEQTVLPDAFVERGKLTRRWFIIRGLKLFIIMLERVLGFLGINLFLKIN